MSRRVKRDTGALPDVSWTSSSEANTAAQTLLGLMHDEQHRNGAPMGDGGEMTSPSTPPAHLVVGLVGVYDADSTLRGELGYWIGVRLGRRHCSLCDITHGSVRERPDWKRCRAGLPVPIITFHRNDQPAAIRAAAHGAAPVIVAETKTAAVLLLSTADLDACSGSIDRLVDAIEHAAARLGLSWPTQ